MAYAEPSHSMEDICTALPSEQAVVGFHGAGAVAEPSVADEGFVAGSSKIWDAVATIDESWGIGRNFPWRLINGRSPLPAILTNR